jgi:hypothetical protein
LIASTIHAIPDTLKPNDLPISGLDALQMIAEFEQSYARFAVYLRHGAQATVPAESVGSRRYDQRAGEVFL